MTGFGVVVVDGVVVVVLVVVVEAKLVLAVVGEVEAEDDVIRGRDTVTSSV